MEIILGKGRIEMGYGWERPSTPWCAPLGTCSAVETCQIDSTREAPVHNESSFGERDDVSTHREAKAFPYPHQQLREASILSATMPRDVDSTRRMHPSHGSDKSKV